MNSINKCWGLTGFKGRPSVDCERSLRSLDGDVLSSSCFRMKGLMGDQVRDDEQ